MYDYNNITQFDNLIAINYCLAIILIVASIISIGFQISDRWKESKRISNLESSINTQSTAFNAHLTGIFAKIDANFAEINTKFTRIDAQFEEIKQSMKEGFKEIIDEGLNEIKRQIADIIRILDEEMLLIRPPKLDQESKYS